MTILGRKLRRDMARSKMQFLTIILTIVVGIAAFGASYDAFLNLKASYNELYDRLHFADLTVNGAVATDVADAARTIDGVSAIETRIQRDVPLLMIG